MSIINFLGIESGFGEKHTNAFFENEKAQFFIDLSMTNIKRAKELVNENKNVFMFITHMHADHISGIPIFIQFLYYVKNKKITFIIPEKISISFKTYLSICGILENMYDIKETISLNELEVDSIKYKAIETYHCPEIDCFGYIFNINNNLIVYTGDTAEFLNFEDYFNDAKEIYIDTSVNYGKVHLTLTSILEKFGDNPKSDIYLMHIDNIEKAKEMIINKEKYYIANII